ncbi:MAG: hypothetical protein ACOCT9_01590 [archaeon]
MTVQELRNKLNKLIEEDKGDYKIYETVEGDHELNHIEEGEVWLREHPLSGKRKICISNNEKEEGVYDNFNLIKKVNNYIEFW